MSVFELASRHLRAIGLTAGIAAGSAMAAAPAHATDVGTPAEPAYTFNLSGFATFAAGRVLGGTHDPTVDQGWHCPCLISDYARAGVYEGRRWQWRPDSKLGLQARVATVDQKYALTAQVVARGAGGGDGTASIEWLYATVELTSRLTLQAGRKRLPLFLYSDVQDIGHALPWIHLPAQVYGWEIVNYDGANLTWRDSIGAWTVQSNAFAGGESARDDGYWRLYNGRDSRTDSRWSNIVGLETKVNRGWFGLRTLYMQSDTQSRQIGVDDHYGPPRRQRIYGLSMTADFDQLFAGAELLAIDRRADYGRDTAQLAWVGYRIGRWTPLLSWSSYRLHPLAEAVEAHASVSAVLRYDLTSTAAVKLQYDDWRDRSEAGMTSMHGDARLLTVGLDMVF